MESGAGRLCNQVEDSKQEESKCNILGVEAMLMLLSSKSSDACQRTTRQVIDCNNRLREQWREEKKEDLKLNHHWGAGKLLESQILNRYQVHCKFIGPGQ